MSAIAAYHAWEFGHVAAAPLRIAAAACATSFSAATAVLGRNGFTEHAAAASELFERMTRRYPKLPFGLTETVVDGNRTDVVERTVMDLPFCRLLAFERDLPASRRADPVLLLVAPMSGHHATLLRDTARRFLPSFQVHITDWKDASMVPLREGGFGLDDHVDHLMIMLRGLGPGTHVMAVCQPSVPALAATALMSEDGDPCVPASLAMLGGPVDTRLSPTAVNRLAEEKGFDWFRSLISQVPFTRPGAGRRVYPGFLQLGGFMSMNASRHASAFGDYFIDVASGNEDKAAKHREFYDEYLAVMDLAEEFYLETIQKVFVEHHMPRGTLKWRERKVDTTAIETTALITVEGGKDDITGRGQTEAAHRLCPRVPASMRLHYVEAEAGHYGIFSGSRFRSGVAPVYEGFVRSLPARAD